MFGTDLDHHSGRRPLSRAEPSAHALGGDDSPRGPRIQGRTRLGRQSDESGGSLSLVAAAALAPLGGVAGVRFYSLQKGPREREADAPPPGLDLVNLGPELDDFAETAAAISELDLVISVCTSVAHLAGALGKPMWVMLHRAADWRWLTERDDSPWYPTARLFRQTRRGEWADVVDRVKAALERRVRSGETVTPLDAEARGAADLAVRERVQARHRVTGRDSAQRRKRAWESWSSFQMTRQLAWQSVGTASGCSRNWICLKA